MFANFYFISKNSDMRLPLLIITATFLTACGGGGSSTTTAPTTPPPAPPPVTYSVGGSISGLETSGLALTNGEDTIRPAVGDTRFSFAQKLNNGAAYAVKISAQPVLGFQACSLSGTASGAIAGANVTDVTANCGSTMARVSTLATNSFTNALGVAIDAAGSIYVAEYRSVRKISGGVETRLSDDARFGLLIGIAVDKDGNVFVADHSNRSIHKITPDGAVTTVATNLYSLAGIAVDKSGNLFVAGYATNQIAKITPAGVLSVLAGDSTLGTADGQGQAATFSNPFGICIDAADNLYVTDAVSDRIRKVTPDGLVTTIAGSGNVGGKADGPAASASFDQPLGIAIDKAGYLYVADARNNLVRKISPGGMVTTLAGSVSGSADGIGGTASFSMARGIAADNRGNLIMVDADLLRQLTPQVGP
ncbi:Sugar lactone lactonase YvrE [Duganella sp. CF458]|uniref:hypothetical protein n=1 Tax=Duganella sp. CF458 TaxID=1884368 RepID=UPI0008F23FC7|nr:hypothetical protein [Duganella sp. CF458]SFF63613.1 Sugar lactone lactonase YvrE [Duganella sp. CF458]